MKRIFATCALLMVGVWASAQVNGQGGVYINGVLQGAGGSSYSYLWSGGISMTDPTTDVAPDLLLLKAANAWPGATTNTAGADTILAGGIGKRILTVVDYSHGSMAGSTVTITTPFGSTNLEEGDGWDAETSNNATATSLAAAVNGVTGVSASASAAVVRIIPSAGTYSLTITKTAADAGMTATSGTDGGIVGTSAGFSIYKAASDANPTAMLGDGLISFGAGGASAVDTDIRYVTTRTLQLIGSGTSTDKVNLWLGGVRGFAIGGTVNMFEFVNTGINLRATLPICWSSGENSDGPFDVCAVRFRAGVLKLTDGSSGFGALALDTNSTTLADTVTLSDAAKTAVLDIAIADAEFIGGTLTYTITATDATDHQALTGIVGFSGVRKNGTPDTYHLTIAESASPVLAESAGASTLTDTWEIDAGTNVATISVTADSSLTTPTMTCRYHLALNSANAVTKK